MLVSVAAPDMIENDAKADAALGESMGSLSAIGNEIVNGCLERRKVGTDLSDCSVDHTNPIALCLPDAQHNDLHEKVQICQWGLSCHSRRPALVEPPAEGLSWSKQVALA